MDRENATPLALILLLILGIESIVAFLGNGFIIVVNGHRWLQSRKMLPCDLLLTALGTTRFLLQFFIMTFHLLNACSSEIFCDHYLWKSFVGAWLYFNSASIWCATWLSVFYCVKITNFAHRLFLWLKPRINVLVPRLLGLSLTVFSFPFIASSTGMKICNPVGNMTGNTSQGEDSNNYQYWIFFSLHVTLNVMSVSICLTASILLLISLQRHTRNLKRSGIDIKDLSTQAHINVVSSLMFFLLFYIQYVVALGIALSYSLKPGIVDELVTDVALAFFSSAHSIILILTNPKLKGACIRILKIRPRTS